MRDIPKKLKAAAGPTTNWGAHMALTADLGTFLETIRFESVPAEAATLARDAFSDTIGVIMAGVPEPIVKIVHGEVSVGPAPRQARACLSDLWISAPDAALINGTAAHALDYDDQALTGHPSAILVPAILAEGEMLGSSGRDMITAYVAGYEVWAELVRRSSNYHTKGWHPTSVFGVVSARRGRRSAPPSGRAGLGCAGHVGQPRRRACGEHRNDDQALSRRNGGAQRHHRGAAGRRRGYDFEGGA